VQRIDEYLKYARQYREEANKAKTPAERVHFARLSEEWERLANYRLAELSAMAERTAGPTPKPIK
jgi:hypothetical protein